MPKKRLLEKYDGKKYEWWKDAQKFVVLVIAVFVVFRFIIGFSAVSGSSMNNTLVNGQIVFYNRLVSDYKVGDIVAVKTTQGEYYVKRIVAVAGDVVDIEDGNLYINGELQTEDYAVGQTEPQDASIRYPLTVQEGDVFVLGDNREVSLDSRTLGAIKIDSIKGRLFLVVGKGVAKGL